MRNAWDPLPHSPTRMSTLRVLQALQGSRPKHQVPTEEGQPAAMRASLLPLVLARHSMKLPRATAGAMEGSSATTTQTAASCGSLKVTRRTLLRMRRVSWWMSCGGTTSGSACQPGPTATAGVCVGQTTRTTQTTAPRREHRARHLE